MPDPRSEAAKKLGEFPFFTARTVREIACMGAWETCQVGVFQHSSDGTETQIGTYERNYSLLETF